MLHPRWIFVAFALIMQTVRVASQNNYTLTREQFLQDEEFEMLGGDLVLEGKEVQANNVIMKAKQKEINEGINDLGKFLPAQSFLIPGVVSQIQNSAVYKIIQRMPKGAVLHIHDSAVVSADYIFTNITFRPDLYVCEVNGLLRLRFFAQPNMTECSWRLLADVRKTKEAETINERIQNQLTLSTENPSKTYGNVNAVWAKATEIFIFLDSLLGYRPVFEDYFYEGLSQFYNDNVLYLELRTALPTVYELDGTQYSPLEVARIYKNVSDRFLQSHPDFIGAKLIFAPVRKVNQQQMDDYIRIVREVKEALPDFLLGFDLTGQEEKGEPLVRFADQLRALAKEGVQYFFHAGETNWYGTSIDENLIDAILLNTKRIGHGTSLTKHPKVLEYVRRNRIPIEVQPIANQAGFVGDLRNHPAGLLFSQNFPVVVSSDDPELWGARALSFDFYEAFVGVMSARADLRALKRLALNSIVYSGMTEDERSRALKIWQRSWDAFVGDLGGHRARGL